MSAIKVDPVIRAGAGAAANVDQAGGGAGAEPGNAEAEAEPAVVFFSGLLRGGGFAVVPRRGVAPEEQLGTLLPVG